MIRAHTRAVFRGINTLECKCSCQVGCYVENLWWKAFFVFFLFWGCSAHGLIIAHSRSTLIIFFWIMIVNTGWAKDGHRLWVFTSILNLWFGSISTAGGGWWRQRYRIRGDRFTPSNPSNRPPDKTLFSRSCSFIYSSSCVFKELGSIVWFTESRS